MRSGTVVVENQNDYLPCKCERITISLQCAQCANALPQCPRATRVHAHQVATAAALDRAQSAAGEFSETITDRSGKKRPVRLNLKTSFLCWIGASALLVVLYLFGAWFAGSPPSRSRSRRKAGRNELQATMQCQDTVFGRLT